MPEEPPLCAAFDDSETRTAWMTTRRRLRGRFCLWSLVFVALLAVSFVLNATAETDYAKGGSNQLGPAIGGLAILWYPFVLYTYLGALSRLKQVRRALEAYPWRHLPAARKATGREAAGVPVHLALPEEVPGQDPAPGGRLQKHSAPASGSSAYGDGAEAERQWSPTMAARDVRRSNRWDEQLASGAWFAGDPCRWGVLTLPGGQGMKLVQRSTANLSGERTSARTDRESVLAAAPRS